MGEGEAKGISVRPPPAHGARRRRRLRTPCRHLDGCGVPARFTVDVTANLTLDAWRSSRTKCLWAADDACDAAARGDALSKRGRAVATRVVIATTSPASHAHAPKPGSSHNRIVASSLLVFGGVRLLARGWPSDAHARRWRLVWLRVGREPGWRRGWDWSSGGVDRRRAVGCR